MPADLRTLLRRRDLGLRLLSDEAELPGGALERPIPWLHSSDLADPTPFVTDGQIVLTTGTQFGGGQVDADQVAAYVDRLVAHGVGGIGFGTEVYLDGTPASLITACRAARLPLFEVPYRTPFIAVIKANADALATEAHARSDWASAAQRAISLAAMRPDGLSATLAELSRQLDCWVGLFDAAGRLDRSFPVDELTDAGRIELQREAAALLRRRQRASLTVDAAGQRFTLQTVGGTGGLRGVLALAADGGLDRAGRDVVASVIALADLALQQNRELAQARGLLRTGLLKVLGLGESALVDDTARQLWGPLPDEPVRVAVLDVGAEGLEAVAEALELQVKENPGTLFFAWDGELVVCTPADDGDVVAELVGAYELHAGLSEPTAYAGFARALAQARQALARAGESDARVLAFAELARSGVLASLAHGGTQEIARAALAPLTEHDRARGTELVRTLRTWLENDCENDRAARALGIHRHTLRARLEQSGRLLGRELSALPNRAELWAVFVSLEVV
ncbi:PucR family transcriptional regulator [Gryllotalpicola koreensis]|uniref:PucR family transcriptional regulator n=1 Tax=Gryllotalpicola koreensis TaxID=993086 RepID=A0ABP7ZYT8_9MICO